MDKRIFMTQLAIASAVAVAPGWARATALANGEEEAIGRAMPEPPSQLTLAATWREGGDSGGHVVGLLQPDWLAGVVRVRSAVALPSRAHGVLGEPDGGFLVVANRPGSWLLRCDAQGRVVRWHHMDRESEGRTLGGHVSASQDGAWLFTTESHGASGQGWVAVRDARTLAKVAQWRTHGAEPHQLTTDGAGALLIANGGILRTDSDKKRDLHLMDSSLVRLNPATGERWGQWRLKDARLSMRHLAWSVPQGPASPAVLGIAMQAEHDDLVQRRAAPVLAVWDGENLRVPSGAQSTGGYAGDIAAGPDGGFVLSCQREGLAVMWSPLQPDTLTAVAQLQEVCALAPWHAGHTTSTAGVLMAAARGAGRWHPAREPALLRWPRPMALDNHWAVTTA